MEEKDEVTMISVDAKIKDRLKVYAAKIKKSMKELTDTWIDENLQKAGE